MIYIFKIKEEELKKNDMNLPGSRAPGILEETPKRGMGKKPNE
jgi:hypothetical protein